MKNMMKLAAIMTAIAMMAGCSAGSSTAATEAAESAVETESAVDAETAESGAEETEAAEEGETEEDFDVDLSKGFDDKGNIEGVTAADYVVLPDYKNAELPKDQVEVTDEEIKSYIDENIMASYQETNQITDRAIVDGDTVNIDYVGSIDGVEFDGGNTEGNGTDVTIGVTQYIDDFLEQLIGHKAGDTFDVNVTFPEDYGKEELNGKDAVFVTTINYISESVTPELTDEWVTENLKDSYDCSTVADVQSKVKDYLGTNKNSEAVWSWLLENSTYPQECTTLIETMLDNYIGTNKMYASYYGYSFEEYLAAYGLENEEAMREQYRSSAEEFAHRYLIAQAISDAEGIEVTDDLLSAYFEGSDYSSYISTYGEGYVRMQVRINAVFEKIMETAKVK